MAWDLNHRILVAVKRPRPPFEFDRHLAKSFVQEALNAHGLATEPNVVKVLDVDPSEPYIVFAYCNEGSLAKRMKRSYTIADVIEWCSQIARPLTTAHGLKPNYIVDHDLKPENILFSDGMLMISDFGGAMFIRDSESFKPLKGYGFTPLYSAPESFDLDTSDARPLDVWSFGVILWELLCGEVPFKPSRNLIRDIREAPLPNPIPTRTELGKTVPLGLVDLAYQCLTKNPKQRPTAQDCSTKLAAL
jgi:serine/threonine-protein kinase